MTMTHSVSRIISLPCVLVHGIIALETYTTPKNEAEGHRKWTGGIYLPHKDHEPAKEGTPYLNTSTHFQLTTSSNQTCQQSLLDTLSNLLCIHHKHIDSGGALLCIDNVIYIQHDCDCFTYDNDQCSMTLGGVGKPIIIYQTT